MSSSVIKSPTPILEKKGFTVFLAGPMKGAPKWQRGSSQEEESREPCSFSIGNLCFGSEDTLAARPQFSSVLDVNQTIVERWNRKVPSRYAAA